MEGFNKQVASSLATNQNWEQIFRKVLEYAFSKGYIQDEEIFENGINYKRKRLGPFQGLLSSPGKILSIDGEDFIEYRILMKPR